MTLLEGLVAHAEYAPHSEYHIEVGKISFECLENSKRSQVIIKPLPALDGYRQMLHYYAVKTIAAFFDSQPALDFQGLSDLLGAEKAGSSAEERVKDWVNIGGQIVPAFRVDELRKDIVAGKYKNWHEIHGVYDLWDEVYQLDKCRHAWAVLAFISNVQTVDTAVLKSELTAALEIRQWMDENIYESRAKDYRNEFKKATFRNEAEMEQVLGKPDDNPFIQLVHKESAAFTEMVKRVLTRVS
jgi:hypothetical protein